MHFQLNMNDNKSKSKNLITGTITYAIGDFGTKILSFLIVPLYTYYISTADMGLYDVLVSVCGLLIPVITLQISDATYKWLISNQVEDDKCIKATYDILIINTVITLVAFYIVNAIWPVPFCTYFVATLIVSGWYNTLLKLIRGYKRQKTYAAIGVVYSAINFLLNLFLIVILHRGIASLFVSKIVAYTICCVLAFVLVPGLRNYQFHKKTRDLSLSLIKFSVPLIPNYLNWWVINSSDSFIVTAVLGASANGILAISHKFPAVLQTVFSLFNSSWQDLYLAEKERDPLYYHKVFQKLFKIMLSIVLVAIPVTKIFIGLFMSVEYKKSFNYIPLYYLGAVYQGFSSFYGVGYLKNNKTSWTFFTSVIAATINIVIDLLAIKYIKVYAAALSTFVGFLVMWIIRERQNKDELGISVNWKLIILLTMVDILCSFVSIKLNIKGNILLLLISIIFFVIFNIDIIRAFAGKLLSRIHKNCNP